MGDFISSGAVLPTYTSQVHSTKVRVRPSVSSEPTRARAAFQLVSPSTTQSSCENDLGKAASL